MDDETAPPTQQARDAFAEADQRRDANKARMASEDEARAARIKAGGGLEQNGNMISDQNEGADGGNSSDFSGSMTFTLDVIEGGEFVRYTGVGAQTRSTF